MTAIAVVASWLVDAVLSVGQTEPELWERKVGERSRVAAIFATLRCNGAIVRDGWSVDCEYNRAERDPKRAPQFDRLQREWVVKYGVPDIVVHRRGALGPGGNLLVVEFKSTYANLKTGSHDMRKIAYWSSEIGYQLGAVVGLGPSESVFAPRVRWLQDDLWTPEADLTQGLPSPA